MFDSEKFNRSFGFAPSVEWTAHEAIGGLVRVTSSLQGDFVPLAAMARLRKAGWGYTLSSTQGGHEITLLPPVHLQAVLKDRLKGAPAPAPAPAVPKRRRSKKGVANPA